MSARAALAIRSLVAVLVLTMAGIVLIAASAHDQRRAAIAHAKPLLSIAAVQP